MRKGNLSKWGGGDFRGKYNLIFKGQGTIDLEDD